MYRGLCRLLYQVLNLDKFEQQFPKFFLLNVVICDVRKYDLIGEGVPAKIYPTPSFCCPKNLYKVKTKRDRTGRIYYS